MQVADCLSRPPSDDLTGDAEISQFYVFNVKEDPKQLSKLQQKFLTDPVLKQIYFWTKLDWPSPLSNEF